MIDFQVVWSNGDASDVVYGLEDAVVIAERAADDTAVIYDDHERAVWSYYGGYTEAAPNEYQRPG